MKRALRRWWPALLFLLLLAVGVFVLVYGDRVLPSPPGGKRRSVEELPQPFRWLAERRQERLLKDIERLANTHDEKSIQRLFMLAVDRDDYVRGSASMYLGDLYTAPGCRADDSTMGRLLSALKDSDADMRGSAALALGMSNAPRAVEPLIAALNDENIHVRVDAANALAKLRDPRAVEPLIAALKTEDNHLRSAATSALIIITGEAFDEDAEKWRAWWEENKDRLKDKTEVRSDKSQTTSDKSEGRSDK